MESAKEKKNISFFFLCQGLCVRTLYPSSACSHRRRRRRCVLEGRRHRRGSMWTWAKETAEEWGASARRAGDRGPRVGGSRAHYGLDDVVLRVLNYEYRVYEVSLFCKVAKTPAVAVRGCASQLEK